MTRRADSLCPNLTVLGGMFVAGRSRADTSNRFDVHHHIFPRSVMDLQEKLNPAWGHLSPPHALKEWTPTVMIDAMDRDGVAVAIAPSPSPAAWFGDASAARQIMRAFNEYAASVVHDHSAR